MWGHHFEGREEVADRAGGGGSWSLRDFGLVLSGVHFSLLGERAFGGWGGGRGLKL